MSTPETKSNGGGTGAEILSWRARAGGSTAPGTATDWVARTVPRRMWPAEQWRRIETPPTLGEHPIGALQNAEKPPAARKK